MSTIEETIYINETFLIKENIVKFRKGFPFKETSTKLDDILGRLKYERYGPIINSFGEWTQKIKPLGGE